MMDISVQANTDMYVSPRLYGKVIALAALGELIATMDLSITNVALKFIGEGLHSPPGLLPWVVSANALSFAGFLILGGRTSDIFGQRNCILSGLSLFCLCSILSVFAPNIGVLIAVRALQGLSSAFFLPSCISLINTLLPEGATRHRAFGMIGIMSGIAIALGLLVGGAVAATFGWRFCFFINLPIAAAGVFLAWQIAPGARPHTAKQSLDLLGALLICGAIALIVRGLSEIPAYGVFSSEGSGSLACGLFIFTVFFFRENRMKDPMLPLSIFRCRDVVAANLVMMCIMAAGIGSFFMITRFMLIVLGFSAMRTGVAMIPYGLTCVLGGHVGHAAMVRWSLRTCILGGTVLMLVGISTLSTAVELEPSYWLGILPGMCIFNFGFVIAFVALVADGTVAVPAAQQGVASAVVFTSTKLGIAVGVAAILMVFETSSAMHPGAISHAFSRAFGVAVLIAVLAIVLLIAFVKGHQKKPVETAEAISI